MKPKNGKISIKELIEEMRAELKEDMKEAEKQRAELKKVKDKRLKGNGRKN